jgi:hypothetical protein
VPRNPRKDPRHAWPRIHWGVFPADEIIQNLELRIQEVIGRLEATP